MPTKAIAMEHKTTWISDRKVTSEKETERPSLDETSTKTSFNDKIFTTTFATEATSSVDPQGSTGINKQLTTIPKPN